MTRAWGGAMRPVPALLVARLRMLANGAWRTGAGRRVGTVVVVGAGGVVLVVVHRVAAAAFAVDGADPASAGPPIAGGLAALVSFAAVTSITFALGSLYLARDLELLLAAPVAPRAVILSRLCTQLGTGAAIAALVAGAPLVAYLGAAGSLAALPLIAVAVLALAALPVALGTGLTIGVVRVIPARRIRDAGAVLAVLTGLAATAVTVALRGAGGAVTAPGPGLPGGTGGEVALSPWLPTGWAARAAVDAMTGRWAVALGWTLLLVSAGGAALLAVAAGLERPYLAGLRRTLEAGTAGSRRRRVAMAPMRTRAAWAAIAVKDLRELRRDLAQLGQLALPVVLFAVYVAAPGAGVRGGAEGRLPPWFTPVLTAAFAALFSTSGIALRGIGLEGPRLWLLRVAPVPVRSVLAAKVLVGAAVALPTATLLVWVGGWRSGLGVGGLVAPTVRALVVVSGLVGLAVGLGAAHPRLDWTDPRRAIGLGLSVVFLAVGTVYLGAVFALLALPHAAGAAGRIAPRLADVAVAVLALAVAAGALRAGAARLAVRDL